jgi:pescadillo protein
MDPNTKTQIALSKERISSLNETLQQVEIEEEPDREPAREPKPKPEKHPEDEALFQDDTTNLIRKDQEAYKGLFSSCHFWLSREVPRESLEFVIKCFGGRVSWDGNGKDTDLTITHCIVDRPKVDQAIITRDYVQPQWVYDSVNNRVLLPPADYAPGAKLPPHLSPFVDDYSTGYVPDYRKKLDEYYQEKTGITRSQETKEISEESESDDDEQKFVSDLNREITGNPQEEPAPDASGNPPKKPVKSAKKYYQQKEEEHQKILTEKVLLSYRKRKLLRNMRTSNKKRNRRIEKLEARRNLLQSGEAYIEGKDTLVFDANKFY